MDSNSTVATLSTRRGSRTLLDMTTALLEHTDSVRTPAPPSVRPIAHRTKGHRRGPITRLMSPGDLGELVKPFVFLDWFEMEHFRGAGFPAHPHSGLATHTTLLEGSFEYGDSTGASGVMPPGSIEWMQAGGGVWHWGTPREGTPVRGYQLWVALPAALEHAPAKSHYVEAEHIPSDGPVRVLLGTYGAVHSAIHYEEPLTYLHVRLRANERWTFSPPEAHGVAWVAVHKGRLHVSGVVLEREMAVFAEGHSPIDLRADGETELVIGSAAKHPHPLVCGSYSVHTSDAALVRGEAGIEAVGRTPIVMAARRK